MPLTKEIDNPARPTADKVIFADKAAAALLQNHLNELFDPAAAQWQQVKQNDSRTVFRGAVNGTAIYIKQFHNSSWHHRLGRRLGLSDARREMNFSQYLGRCNVPVAPPLALFCQGDTEWFAAQAVDHATQADLWHAQQLANGPAGQSAIRQATIRLGELVGNMHKAGVIHCDLHSGNILVRHGTGDLVLMDLHRMKRRTRLSRRAMAANLAQLFHDRLDFTTRTGRLRFLRAYLRSLNAGGTLRGWLLMIEKFVRPHSRRQYANRDRRIFGENRYFTKLRLPNGWTGHAALLSKQQLAGSVAAALEFTPQQWQAVLADPLSLLDAAGGSMEVVKQSRSGSVVRRRLQVGPHLLDVFIKRPQRKQPWKSLIDCFRVARPTRAFGLGQELLNRRIATALPLACLERRVGPFLLDSILIAEAADAEPLNVFLNKWLAQPPPGDTPLTVPQQRQLAQQVLWQLGRMLQRLHDNNYTHRDLKATNVLIRYQAGQKPEVVLVDLDGVKRVLLVTDRRRYQGLMRLNVSLLECMVVNHAGRLRMLLGYLRRPGSGRINFKPAWRTLEKWSAKKLRQQIRSRRRRQKAVRRPKP